MDNISFERIWQDEDFFEIKVSVHSDLVSAVTKLYTTEKSILELSEKLQSNIVKSKFDYLWQNGKKGNKSTPYISLRFFNSDKLGHILIEVYMEIDDGGSLDKHNCCFYIKTELGILNEFTKKITKINNKTIGTKIQLIEN